MADNLNSAKAELLKIKLKDLYMDWRNTRSSAGLNAAPKGAPETVAAPETTKVPETVAAPETLASPETTMAMDGDIMPSSEFEKALKLCEDEQARLSKAASIAQAEYDAFNGMVNDLIGTQDYKGLDDKVPAEKDLKNRANALQTARVTLKPKVGLVVVEEGTEKKKFTVTFKVYTNLSYKYRNMDEYINCLNNGATNAGIKETLQKKSAEWAIEEQLSLAEVALSFEVAKRKTGEGYTYTVGTPVWGKPGMHPGGIILLEPGQALADYVTLTIKRTAQKGFNIDAEKVVQGAIGLTSQIARDGADNTTVTDKPYDKYGNENEFFKDMETKNSVTTTTIQGTTTTVKEEIFDKTTPLYLEKKHAGVEFADDVDGCGKSAAVVAEAFKSTTKAEEKAFVMFRIDMSNDKPKLVYKAKEFGMLDGLAYRKWEGIAVKKQRFMLVSNIQKIAEELAKF